RFADQVERDDRDAVRDFDCQSRAVHARSTTIENPIPPAAQTVINPNCPFLLRSSLTRVIVIRAPVAPNGCPMAIDPPITFSFDRSTSPIGSLNPARSAQYFDFNPSRFDNTCAANASCISTRSMSARVRPARLSATGAASTGPCSSCSPGSSAAYAYDRMIPSGEYPSAFALSSLMSKTHAPPSVSGDELPAVTLPYLRSKTGLSAANCS